MTDILHNHIRRILLTATMLIGVVSLSIFNCQFSIGEVHAQIVISGNVYGGGNLGKVGGNTSVTVRGGDINKVFGGARMADIDGNALVHLDGEHAVSYTIINYVFGGNDIAGTIGTGNVPNVLSHDTQHGIDNTWNAFVRVSSKRDASDNTKVATDNQPIYVGQIFGGGNGDYIYPTEKVNNKYQVLTKDNVFIADSPDPFAKPEIGRVYLEIIGGSAVYAFAGGNNATVTDSAVVCVDNPSEVVYSIVDATNPNADPSTGELLTTERTTQNMALNSLTTYATSDAFQIGSFFGGNNRAEMKIQPVWNLESGKIRNVYSGGNEGDMTSPVGLLLEIKPTSNIIIDNIYGGCRKADVHPKNLDGTELANLNAVQLPDPNYHFPAGYSARMIIEGGDINNVYGGNDISGDVWGGSAVGVRTSIRGNVYGGGNGSYPYTDNEELIGDVTYGDFYYDVNSILGQAAGSSFTGLQSAQALEKHRPHAERVSLRLWGHGADNPTIIGGSVYVGGNSASLRNERDPNNEATGELKIGSHVYANNVFLGNNGENMVSTDVLKYYAGNVTAANGNSYSYSQMDLTDPTTFAKYMDGCASSIRPAIAFDKKNDDGTGDPDTYQDYTTYIGSFFCGGNVGSMKWPGTAELDLNRAVTTFEKIVGGCNDAYVPEKYDNGTQLNAAFMGGVLGSDAEQAAGGMVATDDNGDPITDSEGNPVIKNSTILNFSGTHIEPKRWVVKRDANYEPILTDGKVTYLATDGCELSTINGVCSHGSHAYLEWNTIKNTGEDTAPVTSGAASISTQDDLNRRLSGGNIYGGCYNSGVVNGSIVININSTIMHPDVLFDKVAEDDLGEAILYGNSLDDVLTQDKQNYHIQERRTGVILGRQGMDVLGKALNIFGGGYGQNTEIWGSTTINLNQGYVFQVFGGSERGVIGRNTGTTNDDDGAYNNEIYAFNGKTYPHNSSYSCTVNVRGTKAGVSKQDAASAEMAETEFIYGGGFMGPICGNTKINLGNGRVFNTFAGSCMADILGHTETYIGVQVNQQSVETGEGFPYIRDYTYSGNDLGGRILGEADFISRVREDDIDNDANTTTTTKGVIQATQSHTANVTKASAYTEYRQGRALGIFGGCYGTYDYTDSYYGDYFYATGASDIGSNAPGTARPGNTKPRMDNAFINFRPTDADNLLIGANKYNFVNRIYGAGQGYPGDADRDILQKSSYVLIDIPQRMTNYQNMEVFGAGAWSGLGMHCKFVNKTAAEIAGLDENGQSAYKDSLDVHSATIDLVRGQVGVAYGGSYAEGVTRRTMVNVPEGSTIRIGSIFGGAFGTETFMPCDVYESNVEYHSANATLIYNPERKDANGNTIGNPLQNGAIYGGNNDKRRTLYARINIDKRVNQAHYQYGTSRGYVFGAGMGGNTWAEYTEVNLNDGAEVYEVYGGGQAGKVFCSEAVTAYKNLPRSTYLPVDPNDNTKVVWPAGTYKEGEEFTDADFNNAWTIGGGYDPATGVEYWQNQATNLTNPLVRRGEIDDRKWDDITPEDLALIDHKYNTNVIIREGAYVANYAYGAGLGEEAMVGGHAYITLLGGEVNKDIYAGGTSGPVEDAFDAGNYGSGNTAGFEATTTAYIKGGTVRNVYGGGWRGSVGHHEGDIAASNNNDVPGESHVIIGDIGGDSHINGIPSVTRNVYGGGEGGAIYGTAYVKVYNGYIGFRYKNTAASGETPVYEYVPELDDVAVGDSLLDKGGNVFGGGYVANSYTDFTEVKMFGGTVRGSLFGGGEIGPVGRGTVKNNPNGTIYKAGRTNVSLFGGHVQRDVFGGGRGYDNWNGEGWMSDEEKLTMDLSSKGYVFGKARVNIRGGEIGTEEGVAMGYGNVFGGGDRGFMYSAYEGGRGVKSGARYDGGDEGFYYQHNGYDYTQTFVTEDGEKLLTQDCQVTVGPHCKVKAGQTITLTGIFYPKKASVPDVDLKYLRQQNPNRTDIDANGIVTAENGITIASRTYQAGDYVPTYALQTLKSKYDSGDQSQWAKLEDDGIIIHNAVFAGGNVSSGDDQVYANAPTVFGNATASVHDLYHRDLVTIGTGHVGGIYGDGNLTFVDGYRGLNITNYGTDYHNLREDITYADYLELNEREKAYYELKYKCKQPCTDKDNKTYQVGDMLTLSDLQVLFEGKTEILNGNVINSDYWEQNGVCSRYAGRIMNTIQRADFCGVFGSRLVLQGAPDRVPETVDYTNYTINRVREVSLNKKESIISSDLTYSLPTDYSDPDYTNKFNNYYRYHTHGNYFGIYSIVNYLGAITSDVNMDDKRLTVNSKDYPNHTTDETYYEYKEYCYQSGNNRRSRNRGTSHNKVALASGVYLELTTEKGTGKSVDEKDWGYITGVVELDLINVQTGVGGGYVYAKNVHGTRSEATYKHITLTALNKDAVARKIYSYSDDNDNSASDMVEWETSGNFIHDTQTIIDDCYDVTNSYTGSDRSPAHFWYIKGQVYVYEQYISAYTGAPAAYKESVNIPLTITAASHGQLNLVNIQPNLYAYYKTYSGANNNTVLGSNDKLEFNNKTYKLNDPIDFWEWNLLSATEKALFVPMTYTTIQECKIGDTTYEKGKVLLPAEVTTLKGNAPTDVVANVENVPNGTTETTVPYVTQETTDGVTKKVAFDFIFRQSNNISHNTGYILTYSVNNPMEWNEWYTPITGSSADDKININEYSTATQSNYYNGPTYTVKSGEDGIYGQRSYEVSNIIDQSIYDTYQGLTTNHSSSISNLEQQAAFERAYVVTVNELETQDDGNHTQILYKGSAIAHSNFDNQWSNISSSVAEAYISTATIQLNSTDYIYTGDLMTGARLTELITEAQNAGNTELETMLTNSIVPAYYCTEAGLYGGNYYAEGTNYRALEAWSAMSPADRAHFTFNYDALDVLIDPTYGGTTNQKYQYDAEAATYAAAYDNKAQYSLFRPLDYTATYDGTETITYTYNGTSKTVDQNDVLSRKEYEALPNEQYHYAPILVEAAGNVYVVKKSFVQGETPYAVGQIVSESIYNSLGAEYVDQLTFDNSDVNKTFYYCRSSYTIGTAADGGKPVKAVMANANGIDSNGETVNIALNATRTIGQEVPIGFVISEEGDDGSYTNGYKSLVNKQLHFTIRGVAPVETSTLYVARNSDIYDLSKEKIITVIYQYDYEESDDLGRHITPVSERHIVNIHLQFKSGVPNVETITEPDLVLPGTNIVIRQPNVTPGAYEVLGGGWEIYRNGTEADNHTNGTPYSPMLDPLYWYQDGYYVAYYAKTYLGKTYSNAVPVSVANYHDLKKVMSDNENHYYVDHSDAKRNPKIYINDYSNDTPAANGLTLLKDFFDLTTHQRTYTITDDVQTPDVISNDPNDPLYNHTGVETSQIGGGKNIELILRTDLVVPSGESWTSIGNNNTTQCFEGTLHGDGHTISGLDNSLFAHLCGEVYNLGLTGTFTSAGLADEGTGFVENCWVKSSAQAAADTKAVFNDPTNTATRTNHVANCYYPETSGYTAQTGTTAKSEQAFYNGEVTYNLNEFYLFKRYSDQTVQTGNDYTYMKDVDGTLTKQTGHYPNTSEAPYLMNDEEENYVGSYVETRFVDGDFVYAAGSIPGSADKRYWTETTTVGNNEVVTTGWAPIWPDDYIYFGQTLTYGHVNGRAHQSLPSPINKNGDRLPNASSSAISNRVYRAPAYYRSLTMDKAYFNPDAVFAQSKIDDATLIAHKNMTAIDFTGGNGDVASGYQKGLQAAVAASTSPEPAKPGGLPARFYPPLLDDDGIFSMQNINLTRNLLVYTGTTGGTGTNEIPTAAQQTANVVSAYLLDQAYAETDPDYRTVDVWDSHSDNVKGHWIQGNGSYTALRDHLLVDKQDFNAPISYHFTSGKRMWYQREPEKYVDLTKGWENISLPFTAEIVTTNQKGELTHFYGNNTTGHEYWLREYADLQAGATASDPSVATFMAPAAASGSKTVDNTFLWDYYYQGLSHNHKDKNNDTYQTYYENSRTYDGYPMLTAGVPYLIGFPGQRYYEFDLSGTWRAETTAPNNPARLNAQVLTFASEEGATIGVSDNELTGVEHGGIWFKPNYLNIDVPVGAYVMNAEGNAYDKLDATAAVNAFRTYFGNSAAITRSITFSNNYSQLGNEDEKEGDNDFTEQLTIEARKHRVVVSSYLQSEANVRIFHANGLCIANFTIQPGQTIETPISGKGVYIVDAANGRYRKKLAVK